MVRMTLIVLTCLFLFSAHGQNGFFKIFSGIGQDRAESITQLSNDDLLIVGSTTSFYEAPPQMLLMRLDQNGNKIWSKEFGGPEIDHGLRIVALEDDGVYLFGHHNNTSSGEFDLKIIKTDFNGEFISEINIENSGWDFLEDVQLMPDSSFMLASSTNATLDGRLDTRLQRIDRQGALIWDTILSNEDDDHFGDFQLLSDTSIAYCGSRYNNDSSKFVAFITVLDTQNHVLWDKEYGDFGHYQLNGLAFDREQIYAVGHQLDSLTDEEDVYTLRVDPEGNWLGGYVENSNGKRSFEEVVPFVTPGYFMLSFSRDDEFTFDGGEDVAYFEYDEWLNFQPFFVEVKGFGHDYFGDMITCSDSMVASVGSVSEYGNGDRSIYVFKIGANKVYPTIDYTNNEDLVAVELIEGLSDLKIYPNPFLESFKVDFKDQEMHQVKLIDMQGKVVISETTSGKTQVSVQDSDSGIYLLLIDGQVAGRLLKK